MSEKQPLTEAHGPLAFRVVSDLPLALGLYIEHLERCADDYPHRTHGKGGIFAQVAAELRGILAQAKGGKDQS